MRQPAARAAAPACGRARARARRRRSGPARRRAGRSLAARRAAAGWPASADNESNQPQTFKKDDRLGQLVFVKIIKFMPESIIYVDELSDTDRGNNGFGSSGK